VLEHLALLAEKASSHYISSKFVLFCLVGASGVVIHLGYSEFCWFSLVPDLSALNRWRRWWRWCGITSSTTG